MRLRQALTPSFRNRLRLFFFSMVVVPIVAVAIVLFQLIGESDRSQTDARLGEAQEVALGLERAAVERAGGAAQTVGQDQQLADAIDARDREAVQERIEALAGQVRTRYLELRLEDLGRFVAGRLPAVAPMTTTVESPDGEAVGEILASVTSPEEYVETVTDLTEAEVVVGAGGDTLASTLPDAEAEALPELGGATVAELEYRVTTFDATSLGPPLEVHMLLRDIETGSFSNTGSLAALASLLGFLAIAFAFALAVSRSLQAEVQRLLRAAQRLGKGDFAVAVPTEGNDEFAALGREFNSMARQLESRLAELQRERTRLQDAIRRVGQSAARGLDRDGLLEIVVQTAVDGIGAACGRATIRRTPGAPLDEVTRAGDPQPFGRALHAAEAAVVDAGQVAEIQLGGASALAAPLGTEGGEVMGAISVARGDRAFTPAERELFAYLTNQASVSVENQDLHETVQRQAMTDELTGLFNHRRFQEVMSVEVERARRYGQEMGLIMLDIDNFKAVNDTHGHLHGDEVLRAVAAVLRHTSREIDEPARYGGEEMAVALPQTDLEGAYRFAERVRRRIEALEVPLPGGQPPLKVTASFGVASVAAVGDPDKDALVAAADAALYEAKRTGKNRTVRATEGGSRTRDVHGVGSTE